MTKILKLTSPDLSTVELGNYIEKARSTWAALHYNSPEYKLNKFFSSVGVVSKENGSEAILHVIDNKLADIYALLYFLAVLSPEDLNIRVKCDGLPDIDVAAFFQNEDYDAVMTHFSAFKAALKEWENGENAVQAFTKEIG